MRYRSWWTGLAVAGALFTANQAAAQEYSEPHAFIGLSFVAGNSLGELDRFFGEGFGGQLQGSWTMTEDRRLRFRADVGGLVYGHEKIAMCHPTSCRIGVDLTTTNSIFFFGAGPEYAFVTGGFEPYVFATMGLSYFATISSLSGADDYRDYYDTTNYSDVVMAWKFGGGARMRLSRGKHPVSLDLSVERHENGIANFLTEGDILDHPDGSITLFPNRSEADLLTFRVGISIGLGSRLQS